MHALKSHSRHASVVYMFTLDDLAKLLDRMSAEELLLWRGPLPPGAAQRRRDAIAELKRRELRPRGMIR